MLASQRNKGIKGCKCSFQDAKNVILNGKMQKQIVLSFYFHCFHLGAEAFNRIFVLHLSIYSAPYLPLLPPSPSKQSHLPPLTPPPYPRPVSAF